MGTIHGFFARSQASASCAGAAPSALKGRNSDSGVTNIRNVASPHWRQGLGVESRCVVPFTSFAENELQPDGSRHPVWFALDESRPSPSSLSGRAGRQRGR
jgi:putative SOS response-associated peptidase YedK